MLRYLVEICHLSHRVHKELGLPVRIGPWSEGHEKVLLYLVVRRPTLIWEGAGPTVVDVESHLNTGSVVGEDKALSILLGDFTDEFSNDGKVLEVLVVDFEVCDSRGHHYCDGDDCMGECLAFLLFGLEGNMVLYLHIRALTNYKN